MNFWRQELADFFITFNVLSIHHVPRREFDRTIFTIILKLKERKNRVKLGDMRSTEALNGRSYFVQIKLLRSKIKCSVFSEKEIEFIYTLSVKN